MRIRQAQRHHVQENKDSTTGNCKMNQETGFAYCRQVNQETYKQPQGYTTRTALTLKIRSWPWQQHYRTADLNRSHIYNIASSLHIFCIPGTRKTKQKTLSTVLVGFFNFHSRPSSEAQGNNSHFFLLRYIYRR